MLITVHPDLVAPLALALITTVIAIGEAPEQTIRSFSERAGRQPPSLAAIDLELGEALAWSPATAAEPFQFRIAPSHTERRRHRRKYAKGEMGATNSFYFRGPVGKLNLRANNLVMFLQIAEGIDDDTWLYHLNRHDYSRWIRVIIKDEELADEIAQVEEQNSTNPQKSRELVRTAIEHRYTLNT
jgi:hypothetical protein